MSIVLHTELGSTVLAEDADKANDGAKGDVLTFLKPYRPKSNTSTTSWNCADHFPWVPPTIDIQNSANIVAAVIAARLNGEKLKGEILSPVSPPTTTNTSTTNTTTTTGKKRDQRNVDPITSLEKMVRSYTDGPLVPYMLVDNTIATIKQELVSRGALLCTLLIDFAVIDFLNTRDIEMCLPVSLPVSALSPGAAISRVTAISRVAAIVGYTQDHWIVDPALGCGCLHIRTDDVRVSTHKLFGLLGRHQKQKQTARDEHAPDIVPVYVMMSTGKKAKTKIKPKTVLTLNHGASKGASDIHAGAALAGHVKLPQKLKNMVTTRMGKHADVTYLFDMMFVVMVFICATLVISTLFSKKRNLRA